MIEDVPNSVDELVVWAEKVIGIDVSEDNLQQIRKEAEALRRLVHGDQASERV